MAYAGVHRSERHPRPHDERGAAITACGVSIEDRAFDDHFPHCFIGRAEQRTGDGSPAWVLGINEPFRGTTKQGLGLGVSIRCFVDVYGRPIELDLSASFSTIGFEGDEWGLPRITVFDYGFSGPADGRADGLSIYSFD